MNIYLKKKRFDSLSISDIVYMTGKQHMIVSNGCGVKALSIQFIFISNLRMFTTTHHPNILRMLTNKLFNSEFESKPEIHEWNYLPIQHTFFKILLDWLVPMILIDYCWLYFKNSFTNLYTESYPRLFVASCLLINL